MQHCDARRLLEAQRAALKAEGTVDARARIDRLNRAIDLLVARQHEICAAVETDFGSRSATLTRFVDIYPAVAALKHARSHVHRWMRPRRRPLGFPLGVPGARGQLLYQPLGVVGVISPWNFPITLTFGPLAGILAAGNRCLIKPSELTPATSALLERAVAQHFDPTEVGVVTGGVEVAEAFSRLPLDHLIFTGSTPIGRRVMAAAAENLVPVTLELGGKCPVIVGRSANLARAVDRIMLGKLTNAGQMCLAPDYVYVPSGLAEPFAREAAAWLERVYPDLARNPDYTALVNERQAARVRALLDDALAHGARLSPAGAPSSAGTRAAPVLILGADERMRVMREEIFGPLLAILEYERIESAVAEINARPKPLALYYFGMDSSERDWVLSHTASGGVTVNDVAVHFLAEELPFGGVGESGMGAYHGEDGFKRFSHARAVFHQTRLDVQGWVGLRPPYGARARRILDWLIRR